MFGTGRSSSISSHTFSQVPRANIPRSQFNRSHTHKTAFDSGYLVPIFWDEALPGDTFRLKMSSFARLSTPVVPFLDNLYIDYFFFYIPNRLLWTNWEKFNGAQDNPGDSISYTVPSMTSKASGYDVGSLHDYFGLPTLGQVQAAATYEHNSFFLRGYAFVYNTWFRDENLQNSVVCDTDDGPDTYSDYTLLKRGKRHDYFTSALPWPQKGDSVSIPLGTTAPIYYDSTNFSASPILRDKTTHAPVAGVTVITDAVSGKIGYAGPNDGIIDPNGTIYADLNTATAATINQLRQAFQYQKLLERDARGGTRYTEILLSHFGVMSPDYRLQRPEYLGGGSHRININPVAQNSATGATGTPQGNMAAFGTHAQSGVGFSKSFVEHGIIIGLASVRAELTYQQGLNRQMTRSTRYDYFWPSLAHIGEQAILNKEIYCRGDANDDLVFGYQERYAEYRYKPSMITGIMRSTAAGTLDVWHLSQKFTSLPALNDTFIKETPPVDRVVAVSSEPEILWDGYFDLICARPMPVYGVPGNIDRF